MGGRVLSSNSGVKCSKTPNAASNHWLWPLVVTANTVKTIVITLQGMGVCRVHEDR